MQIGEFWAIIIEGSLPELYVGRFFKPAGLLELN